MTRYDAMLLGSHDRDPFLMRGWFEGREHCEATSEAMRSTGLSGDGDRLPPPVLRTARGRMETEGARPKEEIQEELSALRDVQLEVEEGSDPVPEAESLLRILRPASRRGGSHHSPQWRPPSLLGQIELEPELQAMPLEEDRQPRWWIW